MNCSWESMLGNPGQKVPRRSMRHHLKPLSSNKPPVAPRRRPCAETSAASGGLLLMAGAPRLTVAEIGRRSGGSSATRARRAARPPKVAPRQSEQQLQRQERARRARAQQPKTLPRPNRRARRPRTNGQVDSRPDKLASAACAASARVAEAESGERAAATSPPSSSRRVAALEASTMVGISPVRSPPGSRAGSPNRAGSTSPNARATSPNALAPSPTVDVEEEYRRAMEAMEAVRSAKHGDISAQCD